MADNEIQILIKTVNESSETLKQIQNDVKSLSDKSTKANQELSNSFSKVQGAMLNLGQVAQSIHNVFEIYENSVRKLENAQDRLENSTIRLQQAQQALLDIEKAHSRDTINLEQAQLNLEEAQKKVNIMNNKGITTGREYRQAVLDVKNAQMDLTDVQDAARNKSKELQKQQEAITIAQNNLERSERALQKATGDAKWAYAQMGIQIVSVVGNLAVLSQNLRFARMAEESYNIVRTVSLALMGPYGWAILAGAAAVGVITTGIILNTKRVDENNLAVGDATDRIVTFNSAMNAADYTAYQNKLHSLTLSYEEVKNMIEQTNKVQEVFMAAGTPGGHGTKIMNAPTNIGGATNVGGLTITDITPGSSKTKKVGDAIITKRGEVIQTSPDDNIFATKGGFGNSITVQITGPIYGVNATNISQAIAQELGKKLSL